MPTLSFEIFLRGYLFITYARGRETKGESLQISRERGRGLFAYAYKSCQIKIKKTYIDTYIHITL